MKTLNRSLFVVALLSGSILSVNTLYGARSKFSCTFRDANSRKIANQLIATLKRDPNHKDSNGDPSFIEAVKLGCLDLVDAYLEKNVDVDIRNKRQSTALHFSVQKGFRKIALLLISKNADVNAVNYFTTSPLHIAAKKNNSYLYSLLVRNGADESLRDYKDHSAQYYFLKAQKRAQKQRVP